MKRLSPFLLLVLLSPSIAQAEVKGPFGAALDRYLKELAGFGYSGSVLVAQKGEVVLDQGYGLADRARGTPFTADTLFDIASISKPFTAAAVLRLEMKGKLKVEDKISKFFPDAPADKAGITLHQLLTHTAGFPETIGPEYEPLARKAFLQRIFATKLVHRPGERFLYSNAGYSLLAAVVEVGVGPAVRRVAAQRGVPAGRHAPYRLPARRGRPRAPRPRLHGERRLGDFARPPACARRPVVEPARQRRHPHHHGRLLPLARGPQGDHGAVRSRAREVPEPQGPGGAGGVPRNTPTAGRSPKSPSGSRKLSHVGGNGVFQTDYRRYPEEGAMIAIGSNNGRLLGDRDRQSARAAPVRKARRGIAGRPARPRRRRSCTAAPAPMRWPPANGSRWPPSRAAWWPRRRGARG